LPAKLRRLAKSIPWNRFLGSVKKFKKDRLLTPASTFLYCYTVKKGYRFSRRWHLPNSPWWGIIYTVKKVREFPVPSRDVTTKLSLGRNNDVITELFLPRGSLVSDIPAGDGKLVNLFYGVIISGHKEFGWCHPGLAREYR
jgi:hypothetical protein